MARKIVMRKKVGSTLQDVYPKSLASVIYLDSGDTVESKINSMMQTLQSLIDSHNTSSASVYMLDANEQIETDSDGTGLVNIF